MHPALKYLSHSSIDILHKCPRKYEIYRCSPQYERETDNIDLNFGKALGAGVQALLIEKTFEQAVWLMSLQWTGELYSEDTKSKKSFWYAIFALRLFVPIAKQILSQWRVAEFDGKPAIELSFKITNDEGFKYRGFVDVVLIHRQTLELMVLELKTTKSKTVHEAAYRNSGQALGYSIVLDVIAKQLEHLELANAFKVMYVVYSSTEQEYQPLPYPKHRTHRARWIVQLILEWEKIKMFDRFGIFPMHGENCNDFFRPCTYLGVCELSNEALGFVKEDKYKEEETKFTLNLTLQEIINAQLGT